MNTPCPCGCGRRLPLSEQQILDVTVYRRAAWELDLADTYNCSLSTIRHLRQITRGDGTLVR